MSFLLDDDDIPVGRLLNRREAMVLMGVGTSSLFFNGCGRATTGPDENANPDVTTCVVTPQADGGTVLRRYTTQPFGYSF